MEKDATLSAALDRASIADGDLLTEFNQSVWMRRDDLSFNTGNLQGARFMEIITFVVRPGHMHEWEELVKLVIGGYKKGLPDANSQSPSSSRWPRPIRTCHRIRSSSKRWARMA